MSGVYEANPAALRRSIEGMKQLPVLARKLGTDFNENENDYTEWPGWTDDFAHEVRPRYEENNAYCVRITGALHQALDALVSATLANLHNIEGTQSDTLERIQSHQRRTDDAVGGTGGGKR
ncbi:hypothetical protein [Streptomyces sp. NPDC057702]|uniref:hypothetical protein n=1 Tax=unclassified Streptomyces TaxID=2593676 RepID=UPI00367CFA48